MKPCEKTVSGKHLFVDKNERIWINNAESIYVCVCVGCGLVDDRTPEERKKEEEALLKIKESEAQVVY